MIRTTVAGILASASEAEMTEIELPIPALAFGLITLAIFLVLLGVTFSFKNMANRR